MKNLTKAIALLLTACLLTGATFTLALAEGTSQTVAAPETGDVTQAVATTLTLNDTDVVARVNGTDVTGADVKKYYTEIVGYYGEPDESTVDVYYAIAMEQAVVMSLVNATASQNGLDQYTDEEKATLYQSADDYWQAALENYATSTGAITDSSTDEQKTAAYATAEAYYNGEGYSRDKLREQYVQNSTYQRVQDFVCKDVTVTDQDVQADYDAKVAADKALYENDVNAYENQISLNLSQNSTEKPWYHPAGYRFVRHILLPVDTTLMAKYTDLQARLEEQMDDETASDATAATDAPTESADPSATAEPTQEPVTQADLDNAKAEILASLSDKTTEIYDKIAAGEDFNALIAEYGVNADGSASDPGMTSDQYPNGYEVSLASTTFVPEFVQAAFSVDNVGDVSAPFISNYGVHIVKYMADVPEGPVELTDTLKESLRADLLSSKQSEAMTAWQKAATVEYTGLLKSIAQIQAEMNTGDEAAADDTAATDAPTTDAASADVPATDVPATDVPATDVPAAQ